MPFNFNNEDLDLHTEGFKSALEMAPQNKLNLLAPAVSVDLAPEDGDYFDADFLKPSKAQRKTSFNGPTPDKDVAMVKRVGFYVENEDSAWIKKISELHGLSDPTSGIMGSLEAGRQRSRQEEILQALNGPGYQYKVDKSGELISRAPVLVPFPATQIIDVKFNKKHDAETIAAGDVNQNVTVGKFNRSRTMIKKAQIIGGEHWNIIDEDGLEVMLNKAIMTAREYEQAEKLKDDGIGRLFGFNWIILPEAMPEVAAGVRAYFSMNSRAVVFKARTTIDAQINKRPDRKNALQAYYSEEIGAARMIDEGVVQVNVDLNA